MPTLTWPPADSPSPTFLSLDKNLSAERWVDLWRPEYPLAADELSKGVYRMKRPLALYKRHIEVNTFGLKNLLTFDLDDDEADWTIKGLAYDEEKIPEPNWWTVNPVSGHAHVGYVLERGVAVSPISRKAPQEYLADIRRTLTVRLGADQAYSGMFTRNPLYDVSKTHWGPAKPYSLGELHEALGDLVKPQKAEYAEGMDTDEEQPEGRHQTLFAKVSRHAHKIWYEHYMDDERKGLGRLTHERAVIEYAVEQNLSMNLEDPLPAREVESLATSCAQWTWRTFNVEEFQRIQRQRSNRREVVSLRRERVQMIRDMAEGGQRLTAREISESLGVSLPTAYSYLDEANLEEPAEELKGQALVDAVVRLRAEGKSYAAIALELGKTKDQVRYAAKKAKAA